MKIGNIEFKEFPLILAPMENITDPPFRKLCKEFGADLVYTEFVSSEALIRKVDKSQKKLGFRNEERPLAAQIFGNNPESMREAALATQEFGPDIIDLNFGCPVKKIVSKGCGAALLKDENLMLQITKAVVDAVNLPVTVKTRLGWDEKTKNIVALSEKLQDVGVAAISIHGRTKSMMYKGKADWTLITEVKNNPRMRIPVIGNGDIDSPMKALEMIQKSGVDGIMIGRASIGYPWIFREVKHYLNTGNLLMPPSLQERTVICQRHLLESVEWKGERRSVIELRKHYSGYFKGFPNFKPWRIKLLLATSVEELLKVLEEIETNSQY
jgi:tRNA-dihydrouridine synthase B